MAFWGKFLQWRHVLFTLAPWTYPEFPPVEMHLMGFSGLNTNCSGSKVFDSVTVINILMSLSKHWSEGYGTVIRTGSTSFLWEKEINGTGRNYTVLVRVWIYQRFQLVSTRFIDMSANIYNMQIIDTAGCQFPNSKGKKKLFNLSRGISTLISANWWFSFYIQL